METDRQARRRIAIIFRLITRGPQTVQQLRQFLDTECKIVTASTTLRRDLHALEADNAVECKRGAVDGHQYGRDRRVSYDAWAAVEEGT
jgi:predicted ArsR family transcriptional regulator